MDMSVLSVIVELCLLDLFRLSTAQCPSGFVSHADSCYHFSHDTETWFDALGACEKLYGAYLAEIQDANENNFLINESNRLASNFWIGGNDLQVEGEWKWFTSKTDVTYATWHPGNPSNSGDDENCMEIHDTDGPTGPKLPLWNDNACHVFIRYICEKHAGNGEIVG